MFVGAYHLRIWVAIRVFEPCKEICIYNKVFGDLNSFSNYYVFKFDTEAFLH
jgi:hypothetical protein